MEQKTIVQAQKATETLWDFLLALPATQEAQIFYALVGAGLVGMIANALLKWARGEITSAKDYFFVDYIKATVISFATMIGLAATSIGTDVFHTAEKVFVGWWTVIWFGLTNGFSVDAIVNKGKRSEWTDKERNEKLAP